MSMRHRTALNYLNRSTKYIKRNALVAAPVTVTHCRTINKRNYEPILFACNSGSGRSKGRAPPLNANPFIFMQFMAKLLQSSRLAHTVGSWSPPPLQWVGLVTFSDLKKNQFLNGELNPSFLHYRQASY